MDFDEYEYLEKMVENPEPLKSREESANGGDDLVKSGEKDRSRGSRRRGEDDDDEDRKSKRSKDDARDRDQDRHREKSSLRHRSRSRERERSEKDVERRKSSREHRDRDKEKEREERNGRDRDRGREKEREKEKEKEREREREKEKEKEKEKEREREREKEKEKEKERERDREAGRKKSDNDKESERDRSERDRRSRSHSSRHREDGERIRDRESREKSRDREYREKSRDREYREKSRDREYGERIHDRDVRDKESRRHKEKKDETTEPEADPERDQRTVFAYQLPLRADERDIFEFFSRVGKVRDVRLIMDRNSRRSKGVGYIEFYDVMSVPMAIALSGQLIRGQPVMVKPSEAEKNLVQSTSTTAAGLTVSGAARRLYVGNLVPNITEEQLRVVFESFGTIELVQLPRDEAGLCKGFAFVQFARLEDAKAAQVLNGQLDIGGRVMKVSAVTDQPGMQDAGATTGDLDDDEGGGLSLNASSRALLMQKLDRSGSGTSVTGSLASSAVNSTGLAVASAPIPGSAPGTSPLVAPPTQPSVFPLGGLPDAGLSAPLSIGTLPMADSMGVPSECLLLKNMFDPNLETEPDFDLDIKEDVQDECAKFGALKHIFVDKHTEGYVYLKFDNTQAAMNAQRALHGRWFAGKMISATYMLPQDYETKFPESR